MKPHELPTHDLLVLTGDSVSARQVADLARAVADVMDAHPQLRPTLAAPTEPLRKLKGGFREFTETELARSAGGDFRILFRQPALDLDGMLDVFLDNALQTQPRTHVIDASVPTSVDDSTRAAFVALAIDLFDALEVFHGYVTTADMQAHRKRLISDAVARGAMAAPQFDDPLYTTFDRWLSDAYWVNYFGPAFVDRWGAARLVSGGDRHEIRPSGAVVVWVGDAPPPTEPVRRITDYSFKQRFYDALGPEVFSRESRSVPEPGQLVPTLSEHRAAAGRSRNSG